jgi:hypothetical protein
MSLLNLSIATTDYDHFRDFRLGYDNAKGIEENRATREPMALYTAQQGIAHRQFTPEEIFPAGIMTKVII